MIARVLALLCLTVATVSAAACTNPLHFWIEEGQTLSGNLNTPPALSNNVHETLYPTVPVGNQSPMISCQTGETADYVVVAAPAKHTGTPATYTPFIDPTFAIANGAFDYLYQPTKANPTVWNGADLFTVTAQCKDAGNAVQSSCDGTVYVSVTFTSAATQNTPATPFQDTYTNGVKCTGNCRNVGDGMWLARHTLPRLWDVTTEATSGAATKPTLTNSAHASDELEFEWSSNYAIVSTYGAIGNMAVRFPTFEALRWAPGDDFSSAQGVAAKSSGFDQGCLAHQSATGQGSDLWDFNAAQTDGSVPSGNYKQTSWYQKFNGKHSNCNVFTGTTTNVANVCRYAPLLAPRTGDDENNEGIWRLDVTGCDLKWQGKFTWNAMRAQVLTNGNKAFAINLNAGEYTITGEMYNQAVQPNSWTEPSRGFAAIDHKYLLTVVLSENTDFEFELGIDIFTVDLQHFRFFESNGDRAFGYNMIVYPATLNTLEPNQAPDRRVTGYTWFSQEWIAPSQQQCSNCGTGGLGSECKPTVTNTQYTGAMDAPACASPVIVLYKGPQTSSSSCSDAATAQLIVTGVPGVSLPYEGTNSQIVCDAATYQNITLRGKAPGSATVNDMETSGFGFDGKIVLTFELANGEHPHFVIQPKMYVKSISVDGAFAGSTSTCRGSPSWPVATNTQLPDYVCEEVDARTFGPTDWATIFFDIKDIDASLVSVQKLRIEIGTLSVVFEDVDNTPNYQTSNQYKYFNYRNLKSRSGFDLSNPTAPSGVTSPQDTDFAFSFTPGAHNENAKITIYCTLRIAQTKQSKSRRFASAQAQEAHNTVQESINIQNKYNQQLSAEQRRVVESQSSTSTAKNAGSSSSSGSVTVIVLAAACAVLLAAVIGMVLYVVRQNNSANAAPKRVNSQA